MSGPQGIGPTSRSQQPHSTGAQQPSEALTKGASKIAEVGKNKIAAAVQQAEESNNPQYPTNHTYTRGSEDPNVKTVASFLRG